MSLATVGLKSSVWNNNLRSMLLLGLYPVLLIGIGWVIAAVFFAVFDSSLNGQVRAIPAMRAANGFVAEYWPSIVAIAAAWFMIAWFFHTRMVRSLSGSRPVTRKEEPALYNLLENLCISAGVPMPRIEIVETGARNAFASGIDRGSYSVTVTRGLMQSLQKDELEAVLAHELSHIMNRDVRLLVISVIFTGMFGFAAQLVWSLLRNGMRFGGRGRREKSDVRILIFIAVVAGILWLGYAATLLTRFALSRRREYMADAGSVELTKNPEAMMRALMRIAAHNRIPVATDDIALMCTVNNTPFLGLFATHPPIEARIAALAQISGAPVPDRMTLPPARQESRLARLEGAEDAAAEVREENGAPRNPWLLSRNRNPWKG